MLKGLGKVSIENLLAHPEVRFIKVVGNVPSNLSILPPLLYHSMEKGKSEHQGWESIVGALWQGLSRDLVVGASQVQFQSIGGFCDNLFFELI